MSEQQTSAFRVIEQPFQGIGAVSTLILRISPEDAQNLQTHCYFSRARPLIIANIKRLAAEMVAERFVQGTVTNLAILPDGRKLLLNGNHVFEAIKQTGLALSASTMSPAWTPPALSMQ